MNMRIGFLLSLLVPSLHAHAIEPPAEPRTWYESIGYDLAAPVLSPGRNYALLGSALTLITLPLKNTDFQSSIAERKPLGSTSSLGYELGFWKINAAYILSFLGYGFAAGDSLAIKNAAFMLRATIYTGLLTTGIKALHLEERPRGGGDLNSFPSGHASNIFAFSGVIYRNHGWTFGAPAFAAAAFVGFSRMNDNAHYLHDVLFGAGIGLSYAMGLDTEWNSKDESKSLALVPIIQSDALGAGAILEF